jgi:hypothetical protein
MAKYTNIQVIPGTPETLITSDEAFVPTRYFGIDSETGEEVELLSTKDYYAGFGPEGSAFIAKPKGDWYQGQKGVYNDSGIFKPFEAVDAEGNVIGTWNLAKNELSDFAKYGGAAIKTAATILAGQALMPSITKALGLPTDLFGTTQTMPAGVDSMTIADATQLASQGLNPQQISQILGQQYALDPTIASKIAQLGFDNAFAALDATRLAEITTDPNAIQQNLIAAGIDPSIAADLAQQAALGLDASTIANDLANFYQGSPVYTNAGLLEGGSTLDEFGKQISTISSTGDALNLVDVAKGVNNLANALNPTQQQQPVVMGGGGGRQQSVDFSNILGLLTGKASLLPAAQQYQRGLLG